MKRNYYDFNEVKRITSAKKIKDSAVLSEDRTPGHESAVIQGSSDTPYEVTLDGCTCVDFAMNNKPCKHMYKLMLDCALLDVHEPKPVQDRTFDFAAEIDHFEKLYLAGEIDHDTFIKVCSALPELKKKRKKDRTFDPATEIERYKNLYIDGELDDDTYVKVCLALAKMK